MCSVKTHSRPRSKPVNKPGCLTLLFHPGTLPITAYPTVLNLLSAGTQDNESVILWKQNYLINVPIN